MVDITSFNHKHHSDDDILTSTGPWPSSSWAFDVYMIWDEPEEINDDKPALSLSTIIKHRFLNCYNEV